MNCEVIRDLLILYADNCCSEESKALVEEHLKSCPDCRKALSDMNAELPPAPQAPKLKAFSRVNLWKASLLQSILLYVSFALLVFGVFRESVTSYAAAQNIVVIKTLPGLANGAAGTLDSMNVTDLVGTLAGDDTALLVMKTNAAAEALCEEIKKML